MVNFDGMPSPPTRRDYIIPDFFQSVGNGSVFFNFCKFPEIVLDFHYMYATRAIQLFGCKFWALGDKRDQAVCFIC